jgi:RNA polymerase sigma-70 factor (ECF subfamily)
MSDVRGLSAAQWRTLYERLEKPLYNFAFRHVWVAQEAEDVVHDAFLRIWERRAHIVAATADRYLWTAVVNGARNRRRWARAKNFLHLDGPAAELPASQCVEAQVAHQQVTARLRAEIDRLPEKLRTVLLLAEFGEMRYEDIAQLLAIPSGTVASRRHLAVKLLRARTGSDDR